MPDARRKLIDSLPGLLAASDVWRAERIAFAGYGLTFALFFLVPAATQRMVFYVLVCLPVIVLIAKKRIEWPLFCRHAGLALAAALIVAHVATMAWSTGFSISHAYHDGKDALALAVFAYVTTWFVVRRHDVFWRVWPPVFLTVATVTGFAAMAATIGESGSQPLTGFGAADHTNSAATLYGVSAILAGAVAARARARPMAVAAGLIAVVVSVMCVVLTESRAGIVALAAAAAVVVLIQPGLRRHAAILAGLGTLLILGAHTAGLIDLQAMIAEGSNSRFALWADAIAHIRERPLLGHGMLTEIAFQGADGLYRSPHNVLLSTQVFAGLPGSVLLLSLIGLTLARAVTLARAGTMAPVALVVFGLVNGLFAFRTLVDGLDRTWLAIWFPVLLTHAEHEWTRLRAHDQDLVGQP